MSEEEKKDTRSSKEIQQDLEKRRRELAETVNLLADRVSPKAGIESAKAGFMSVAKDASKAANSASDDALRSARIFADEASMHAKIFVEDVKRGDPKSIALAGVAVAGVATLLGLSFKR